MGVVQWRLLLLGLSLSQGLHGTGTRYERETNFESSQIEDAFRFVLMGIKRYKMEKKLLSVCSSSVKLPSGSPSLVSESSVPTNRPLSVLTNISAGSLHMLAAPLAASVSINETAVLSHPLLLTTMALVTATRKAAQAAARKGTRSLSAQPDVLAGSG